jgi:hypothetical protein
MHKALGLIPHFHKKKEGREEGKERKKGGRKEGRKERKKNTEPEVPTLLH